MSFARYISGYYFNSGTITGPSGLYGSAGSFLVNAGVIQGTSDNGVVLASGDVINRGVVLGQYTAISIDGAGGYVYNDGVITSSRQDGVFFDNGGTLVNRPSGEIYGQQDGVTGFGATVENFYSILGEYRDGADMIEGGTFVNSSQGVLTGGQDGVAVFTYAGVVTNYGIIQNSNFTTNPGNYVDGVFMDGGGTVFNSGRISGTANGVRFYDQQVAVTNSGRIVGYNRMGASFYAGGTLVNQSAGYVYGKVDGVTAAASTQIINQGRIEGRQVAVLLGGGGYVDNTGMIAGNYAGVELGNGGSIVNGSTGSILGTDTRYGNGVELLGTAPRLTNTGRVAGYGESGVLVDASGNAVVSNGRSGVIYGRQYGIGADTRVIVSNSGSITGASDAGILLRQGGSISNAAHAYIGGYSGVNDTGGVAIVSNSGTIEGNGTGFSSRGVNLRSGGTVVNNASGRIVAGGVGVYAKGALQLTNHGVITASRDTGVSLAAGGHVTNAAGARISGFYAGIAGSGAPASIANAGSITASRGIGVYLNAGGLVTNAAGGIISGGFDGVGLAGGGSISNAGTILATDTSTGAGVLLDNGGTLTNLAGGVVTGAVNGVYATISGPSIANAGHITGTTGDGVLLEKGGMVNNSHGGSIRGGRVGILVTGGNATVVTSGTIGGSSFALDFTGGGSDRLVVEAGAVFAGKVSGAGAVSSLVLAGGQAGTISGLGTQLTGFKTLTEDSGANWTVTGTNNTLAAATSVTIIGTLTATGRLTASGPTRLSGLLRTGGSGDIDLRAGLTMSTGARLAASSTGRVEIGTSGGAGAGVVTVDAGAALQGAGSVQSAVVDKGRITASGGTLSLTGNVSGPGTVSITSSSVLSAGGSFGASLLQFLNGGHERANFAAPTKVAATLQGFVKTDFLDLQGFAGTSLSYSGHTLTVHGSGGAVVHLAFAGSYTTSDFSLASDGHGGSLIGHT